MSDYDYLNARVRGMGTSLLSGEIFEQILGADSEDFLTNTLLSSPYQEELREALTTLRGRAAVEAAIRKNVRKTFAKIRSCAPPEPRRLITLQLNRWDLANVLALVRGKLSGSSPQDTLEAVMPIGELEEAQLGELAGETDLVALADALTTWKHPFAFVLRRAIRENAEAADPLTLEIALQRAYFLWALAQLREDEPSQALVRDMMRRQIDLANIMGYLDLIRRKERGDDGEGFDPIPRGKLPPAVLKGLATSDTMESAFETLENTYFAPAIERGILAFGRARSLGVMERFLEAVVIDQGCRMFRRDVLSAGVPLGFIWRKYRELVNLRILLRSKAYRVPPDAVREELILV